MESDGFSIMRRFVGIFLSILLCFDIIFNVGATDIYLDDSYDLDQDYTTEADYLASLGLFKGTGDGYALEDTTTRGQGAVMLVRLLGKEVEALDQDLSSPFIDVEDWLKPYVNYLYNEGLTQGIDATHYGADEQMTASQYMTMLLRALGYEDQLDTPDFVWNESINFAFDSKILSSQDTSIKNLANQALTRNYMVHLSYRTLKATMKEKDSTLEETLVASLDSEENIGSKDVSTKTQDMTAELEGQGILEEAEALDDSEVPEVIEISDEDEVKGMWFSYLDLIELLQGKTESEAREAIEEAFSNVVSEGLNTVFVQVRPMSDALYPSSYYPWSSVLTGQEGQDPGYDPLAVMLEVSHDLDLRFDAWINPYRVKASISQIVATDDSTITEWLASGDRSVRQVSGGYYLNPGKESVRQLIVAGIEEIVDNYDVDGILFDDYFYPTTDESFDSVEYQAYSEAGGTMSLSDWRREQVNILIRDTYAKIKELNPDVLFGISPQGIKTTNYDQLYADTDLWMTNTGYIDYIIPQIYYGFDNQTAPFDQILNQWTQVDLAEGVQLYVALAAYKIGLEDTWAGSGKTEWTSNSDMLERMVKSIEDQNQDEKIGWSLFSYRFLYGNEKSATNADLELEHLKSLLP